MWKVVGNLVDLTGKKFGRLTVLYRSNPGELPVRWMCSCECGKQKAFLSSGLRRGDTKSCNCYRSELAKNRLFKGVGDISASFWSKVCRNSHGRARHQTKREVEITITEAWELFLRQDRKCAYTGEEIYFPPKHDSKGTASLDRIDSSKGYIKGNIQWVHKDINRMKTDFSHEHFIELCRKVAQNG